MSSLTSLAGIRHRRVFVVAAAGSRRRLSSWLPNLPVALVPPKQVPAFVSRSEWNKLYRPPPRQPPPKNPLDDKPYPLSVRIMAGVVAAVVVPYCMAWLVASNGTMRELLGGRYPGLVDALRPWFGEEEVDAISYVDRRQNLFPVPRQLEQEAPAKVRQEQAALAALQEDHLVPTRIRVFTKSGFNLGEIVDLPGNTPAKEETLLQILMKDRNQSIEKESVSHVTVEFTDVKDEGNDNKAADHQEESAIVEVHLQQAPSTVQQQIAKMIKSTTIYSAWHVFHEYTEEQKQQMLSQQNQQQAQQSTQPDNLRILELEYEIEQLEKQLKDHATLRSFDDIQQDLNQAKRELSRLKWKRRLRIFG